jgi:hypothetical protein
MQELPYYMSLVLRPRPLQVFTFGVNKSRMSAMLANFHTLRKASSSSRTFIDGAKGPLIHHVRGSAKMDLATDIRYILENDSCTTISRMTLISIFQE